jgi:hypothetical protein
MCVIERESQLVGGWEPGILIGMEIVARGDTVF